MLNEKPIGLSINSILNQLKLVQEVKLKLRMLLKHIGRIIKRNFFQFHCFDAKNH